MSCKVYVGNLGENGDRDTIEQEFSKFGIVESVWLARNPPGFAFVFYSDPRDAEEAVRVMDNKRVCGVKIKAELSHHSDEKKQLGKEDSAGRGRGMGRGRRPREMNHDDPQRGPGSEGRQGAEPPHPRHPGPIRPPSRGPPPRGLPSRGPSARGPPTRGPPTRGPPARGPPARGPPARGQVFDQSPDIGPFGRNQDRDRPFQRSPPPNRSPPSKWTRESPPRGPRRSFQEGPLPPYAHEPIPRERDLEPPRPRLSPRREMSRRMPPPYSAPRRGQLYDSPPKEQLLSSERLPPKRPMFDRSPPRDLPFKRSPPRRNHSFESSGSPLLMRRLPNGPAPRDQQPSRRSFEAAPRGFPPRDSPPGGGRNRLPRRSPPRQLPPDAMPGRGNGREMLEQGRRFEPRERDVPFERAHAGERSDTRAGYGRRQEDFPASRHARKYGDRDGDQIYERESFPGPKLNRTTDRGLNRGPERSVEGPGGRRPFGGNPDRFNDRPQGERVPNRLPPPLMAARVLERPPTRRGERPPSDRGAFRRSRSPLR